MKPALASLIAFLLATPVAAQDTDFWSTPRRGTNSFNTVESRRHLADARDFGAGFVRLTYAKWKGVGRDFLAGDLDRYDGLEPADLARLRQVLDDAAAESIPIVLTPLDLPGARWRQNNDNQVDDRLWQDRIWWDAAARYWADIAREFRGHPAIVAYNILKSPFPNCVRVWTRPEPLSPSATPGARGCGARRGIWTASTATSWRQSAPSTRTRRSCWMEAGTPSRRACAA